MKYNWRRHNETVLVLGWNLLGMIDDEDLDRSLTRLQFETELVNGCEDGRPENSIAGPSFVSIRVRPQFVRSPLKVDTESSCQPCSIDNGPIQQPRQRSCKALHGY